MTDLRRRRDAPRTHARETARRGTVSDRVTPGARREISAFKKPEIFENFSNFTFLCNEIFHFFLFSTERRETHRLVRFDYRDSVLF